VGVGTGSDSGNKNSDTGSSASQQYQTVGGDGLLNGNSDLWIQSVGSPEYWRVIQFGRFVEMTDFLPSDITDAMTALQNAQPNSGLVTSSATTSYTKSLDNTYIRLNLTANTALSLGTLAQAGPGDVAMLRSGIFPYTNTTIWLATYDASSRGLKLKTLGSPSNALYLTMQDDGTLTLETLKYGDVGTSQTWVLADNNGQKGLISVKSYLAVGEGASEAQIRSSKSGPPPSVVHSVKMQDPSKYSATQFKVVQFAETEIATAVPSAEGFVDCACCRTGFASVDVPTSTNKTMSVSFETAPEAKYDTAHVTSNTSLAFTASQIDNTKRTVQVASDFLMPTWSLPVSLLLCPNPDVGTAPTAVVGTGKTASDSVTATYLWPPGSLGTDEYIWNPTGTMFLKQQADGNLVVYNSDGKALWANGQTGKGVIRTVMQSDGNLVSKDASGNAKWSSGTGGNPGASLALQSDNNVVIYTFDGNPLPTPLWNTGTNS
jgi:hypothetical protein